MVHPLTHQVSSAIATHEVLIQWCPVTIRFTNLQIYCTFQALFLCQKWILNLTVHNLFIKRTDDTSGSENNVKDKLGQIAKKNQQ